MEPRIIMLDIDGVLNYACQGDKEREANIDVYEYPSFAPNLAPTYAATKNLLDIYLAYLNTKIVITSTWGNHLSHFGIWETLLYTAVHHEEPMSVHFDSVTPKKLTSTREEEINMWRDNHPEIKYFVILDDITMSRLSKNAVKVNPEIGLTKADVDKAIKILGKL